LCTCRLRLFKQHLFSSSNSTSLLSDGSISLLLGVLGFGSKDTSSPGSSDFSVLVEVIRSIGGDGCQSRDITSINGGDCQTGGSLLVDNFSEARFALDDDVRNVHLSAKSGQPDDKLDGFNIVSNHNELSLLLLNQRSDLVQSVSDCVGSSGGLGDLSVLVLGGSLQQSSLLSNSSFRSVFVQQLEKSNGRWLISGSSELVEGGRNLQSVQKNSSLSLHGDVSGPSDVSSQIFAGLDVLTNSKRLGFSLNQRVSSLSLLDSRWFLGGSSSLCGSGGCFLGLS